MIKFFSRIILVIILVLPFSLSAAEQNPSNDRIELFQHWGQSLFSFARQYSFTKIEVKQEEIPFTENYVSAKDAGTTVVTAGVNGLKEVTYLVHYNLGVEVGRDVLSEKILKEPINKVISTNWDFVYTCKNMSYYTSYWTVDKFVKYRRKNFYLYNNDPRFFVANKELPLGTRIKIVGKASGKEVYANVTDYGPVGGCIDASYWTFGAVCDHDDGRCAVDMYKLHTDK